MSRSFDNVSTSSEGKIKYESELVRLIPRHRRGEKIITLLGALDGVERQLALLTSNGARVQDIIVIERDLKTYRSLEQVSKTYGFHVYHGDFMFYLSEFLLCGMKFSFVDYDGTEAIGEYTMSLTQLCSHYHDQVRSLHIVASVRANRIKLDQCAEMAKLLDMPDVKRYSFVKDSDVTEFTPKCRRMNKMTCPAPIDIYSKFVEERTLFDMRNKVTYHGRGRHIMYGLFLSL